MCGVAVMLFAASSALVSPSDYVFRPFKSNTDAANWIEGRIMGKDGDYSILRAEDVAFIDEAWYERRAMAARAMPTAGFNVVSNRVIKSQPGWGVGGRYDMIYIATNLPLRSGTYTYPGGYVENYIAGNPRTLTNLYLNVSQTNYLSGATRRDRVQWNFELLGRAKRLVYSSSVTRGGISGVQKDYSYSESWYQGGYPDTYDWYKDSYESGYTNTYTSGSDYYLQHIIWKTATLGSIRDSGDWQYELSDTAVSYDMNEKAITNAVLRYDLGLPVAVATTGGAQRVASVRIYQPFQVTYSATRDFDVSDVYWSTNVTVRLICAMDSSRIDYSGVNVVAEVDYSPASVAADACSVIALPSPAALTANDIPEPQQDGYYVLNNHEARTIELTAQGGVVAVITCAFKTSL